MILYRVMCSYELKKLMGIDVDENDKCTICGNNTFTYEPNTEYIHFFRYAEHAKQLIDKFGIIIAKCDIPDELIDQEGFGFYLREISTLPEVIVKKENFNVNFIKGFKYDLTVGLCTPNIPPEERKGYIGSYGELYKELFNDLKKEYYKENPPVTINTYIASKLKNVDLDKLLLNYIDRVHLNHHPEDKHKIFKKTLFKKK